MYILVLSAVFNHFCYVGQILSRRSAAVISYTPKHKRGISFMPFRPVFDYSFRHSHRGIVAVYRPDGFYFASVKPYPKETVFRQGFFARIRATANVSLLPALFQNLNKPARMPEGIEIYRNFRHDAELFLKIFVPLSYLSYEAFPRRHIAIGLKIPTAHNSPFPAFYEAFYSFKQLRGILFHVFINRHFIVTEYVIELLRKVCRRFKGRQSCADAFLPLPLPDRIDMRVTYQMYFLFSHSFCLFSFSLI